MVNLVQAYAVAVKVRYCVQTSPLSQSLIPYFLSTCSVARLGYTTRICTPSCASSLAIRPMRPRLLRKRTCFPCGRRQQWTRRNTRPRTRSPPQDRSHRMVAATGRRARRRSSAGSRRPRSTTRYADASRRRSSTPRRHFPSCTASTRCCRRATRPRNRFSTISPSSESSRSSRVRSAAARLSLNSRRPRVVQPGASPASVFVQRRSTLTSPWRSRSSCQATSRGC